MSDKIVEIVEYGNSLLSRVQVTRQSVKPKTIRQDWSLLRNYPQSEYVYSPQSEYVYSFPKKIRGMTALAKKRDETGTALAKKRDETGTVLAKKRDETETLKKNVSVYLEEQARLFDEKRKELIMQDKLEGQYVVFKDGKVVLYGSDESVVIDKAYKELGTKTPFLFKQVLSEEPDYIIDTPFLLSSDE